MFKSTLFKVATPILCALSMALTSFNVSAAPYYGNNGCCQTDCCDPCQNQCNKRGWWKDAAIFVGSAAVGAIAGVAAANSNRHRGRTGPIGPQGPQGFPGVPGLPGLGFVDAVVPANQVAPLVPGAPITSLDFTFTATVAIGVDVGTPNSFQAYVTTPDGRTFLGTTFTGAATTTATVSIPSGPFFRGNYDVGIISRNTVATLAGLVTVTVTNINGTATTTPLDPVGIVNAVSTINGEFFNAQYPFNEVP